MNLSIIRYILGWVLQFEALFMLCPAVTGLIYREYRAALSFFGVAALCAVIGFLFRRRYPKNDALFLREGFATVALSWFFLSLFGCIPFLLSGDIPNFVDALFETASGFTTTGASILTDVEAVSRAGTFWRCFSHWIGGMGVFMFILAILPLMGGYGMNLMRAESPGPSVGKVLPKVKTTAMVMYGIYIGITVICLICYLISGMPLYDALNTTFGTVGTGGFGIYNSSAGSFTPLQQNMITVFMILSGINYNLYFLLLARKFRKAFSLEEVRCYLIIIVISSLLIAYDIRSLYETVGARLRHAFFQVGSIMTSTGYSTADFDQWPQMSRTILVILMLIGACAGSTGGGFKVSRFLILIKAAKRKLTELIHPNLNKKIYFEGEPLSEEVLSSTNAYTAVYFIVLFGSVLLISLDGFDFTSNFTAVTATLNNIGPGLSAVGPAQSYAGYSIFSKCVLIFDMLAGRLELFPVLILFMPSCWKKY
ncbi:MAG: TrkH family potassium uptake protein [Lachnospiraceae bacterium]|nr:TrkH family potassium uptake protein [Lachnospiraceae bacterium]